eukprot:1186476-Prorocentrum_minimum.AAC.6
MVVERPSVALRGFYSHHCALAHRRSFRRNGLRVRRAVYYPRADAHDDSHDRIVSSKGRCFVPRG